MCIIRNHKKTTLQTQDFFEENFYIWERKFSLGQIFVGKISNYQGQIFEVSDFFSWGNFEILFLGQILFLRGFFGQFCVW